MRSPGNLIWSRDLFPIDRRITYAGAHRRVLVNYRLGDVRGAAAGALNDVVVIGVIADIMTSPCLIKSHTRYNQMNLKIILIN